MAAANACSPESDQISIEELDHWDIDSLKDFCRRRGYKITGTRRELTSRVYFLYNEGIPEEPTAKETEASNKKDYQAIVSAKLPAPDPLKSKRWNGEQAAIQQWPPVSFIDIHWFLRSNGSTGLTRESLTAYKEGKAYSYFSCDWLKEVFYSPISKTHKCCFLKAECTPSNRVGDLPHVVWVKVMKESGEVLSAFCSCVAGYSQSCNHVAALLFKINAAFKLELSNPGCTSAASQWTTPTGAKIPINLKLREMSFIKPSYSKGKAAKSEITAPVPIIAKRIRETLEEEADPDYLKSFIADIRADLPQASLFLPGKPRQVIDDADEEIICLDQQSNDDSQLQIYQSACVENIVGECLTSEDLLTALSKIDSGIIGQIPDATAGQNDNPLWQKMRYGRITASNFYRVYTKVQSMKKEAATSCEELLTSLINPVSLGHLPQIQAGQRLEKPAMEKLVTILADKGHRSVSINSCGLYVYEEHRYLGASPDGIVRCECCPPRLVEIKCPSTPLSCLPYLDKQLRLKQKRPYYGQIQGQMLVTGIKESWFFIFYENGKHHLELIKYDADFCKNMLANLVMFYTLHVAPRLVLGRKRKID